MLHRVNDTWLLPAKSEPPRRPPPPLRDADMPSPFTGDAEWEEWRCSRGGGVLSWLRWLRDRGEGLTQDERARAYHHELTRRHDCHRYRGDVYCFHRDPHVHPELRDVPIDTPIAKEGES